MMHCAKQVIWTMLLCPLLLPGSAQPDPVYRIRPLSHSELLKLYGVTLLSASRFADREWHDCPATDRCGYWGNGISDGNEGIRAIACMVLANGTLMKYATALKGAERRELTRKSSEAIRYAVSTHVTGARECVDGKKWGNSWQSAYWTGTLAFGAWLMWDSLEPGLRQGLERVVASEADRFLNAKPVSGRWRDTKAEENGWNLICISAAANMFPAQPHAGAWRQKAIEYMMNTLSVARDRQDSSLTDGRPIKDWICTETMHPDYTLENHNIFHPSYVQCSSYFLTQAAMHYTFAGNPVPQAASHHLMDTWGVFQSILLPSGETAFPQGMDWELHNLPAVNLFASLATLHKDPLAAQMERTILQYMRAWQEWCGGSLTVPGSPLGFTRHAIQAEQTAYGYLAHRLFGNGPEKQSKPPIGASFVRSFSHVGILIHRTPSKFASFSWKNRVMGVFIPASSDRTGNPFFTVPITNGFVGATEVDPGIHAEPDLLDHTWKRTASGFETAGTLLANGGLLRQRLGFHSIGERTLVYQDRITALAEVSVTRELGAPIGIENDSITGGRRVVHSESGQLVFDWQKSQPLVRISGPWVNVDGRLAAVVAAGSGLAYRQAASYNAQGVHADVLYMSFADRSQRFQPGDQVARRVVVLFAETTPEVTSRLARSVRIEATPDGEVLRLALPEGGETSIELM